MEAALKSFAISAVAPVSGFTGSSDVLLFEAGATDAQRTSMYARRILGLSIKRDGPTLRSGVVDEQADNGRISGAIQSLYLSANRPRDRQIAERITTLHRHALAEGEEIAPASLSQFTEFFLRHGGLGLPKITLTPDGTLRARWIHGPKHFIAIEFTGEPLLRWIAEVPRQDGQTAAYFANEPVNSVVSAGRAIGAAFE